jgi:hypothetical protein
MDATSLDAGSYVAGPFKIVHHTTDGAFETYRKRHEIPHFMVDDKFICQHVDAEIAATALAHPADYGHDPGHHNRNQPTGFLIASAESAVDAPRVKIDVGGLTSSKARSN